MANNIKPKYNCSQSELYSSSTTIWDNYIVYQADFAAKKAIYTMQKATDAKAEIADAQALPDAQVRGTAAEVGMIHVREKGDLCMNQHMLLRSYIRDGFEEAEHEARYEEAGASYYRDAGRGDWEAVSAMNAAGKLFIATHLTELTANNNMPAGFETEFGDAVSGFVAQYDQYKADAQTGMATEAKILANNHIYTKLMSMCEDAQIFFKDDGAKQDLFTFSKVIDLISADVNGLDVEVKDSESNELLADALVDLQNEGAPSNIKTTDENGKVSYRNILAGNYRVKVQRSGYVTQVVENVVVSQGVVRNVTLLMIAG